MFLSFLTTFPHMMAGIHLNVQLYQLTEEISKINNDIITQRAKSLSKNKRFDKNSFWRLKRNLFSKQRENKVSVINTQGTELFDPAAIIKEYQNEFIKRLSPRQMDQDYKGIEEISSRLFNIRLRISRGMNLSPDFNMKELEIVVKSLKNGKSTDPEGLINELFKYGGLSYQTVLLQLLNKIKNNKDTPESWNNILISTIYKKKGSKKLLNNQRGIFITPIISKIFEKLIREQSLFMTGTGAEEKKIFSQNF